MWRSASRRTSRAAGGLVETVGVAEGRIELGDGVADRRLKDNAVAQLGQIHIGGKPFGDLGNGQVRPIIRPDRFEGQPKPFGSIGSARRVCFRASNPIDNFHVGVLPWASTRALRSRRPDHARGALEGAVNRRRHAETVHRIVDGARRIAERIPRCEVEREGGGDELPCSQAATVK
jgi:hypothetical protein